MFQKSSIQTLFTLDTAFSNLYYHIFHRIHMNHQELDLKGAFGRPDILFQGV